MSHAGLPYRCRSLLALVVLLAACVAIPVGSSVHPVLAGPSYLFLSPNTDDHLSPAEASRRLASPAQFQYHQLAGDILKQLGVNDAKVHDVLGDWDDNVENSLLVVLPAAHPQTLRCAAAWFGLVAQQKAVLAFHPDPEGNHRLTVLDLPGRNLAAVRRLLDEHGIHDRTILVHQGGCRVIVLESHLADPALRDAALAAHGRLHSYTGRGECLAGGTRLQARERYAEIIQAYQLSQQLACQLTSLSLPARVVPSCNRTVPCPAGRPGPCPPSSWPALSRSGQSGLLP